MTASLHLSPDDASRGAPLDCTGRRTSARERNRYLARKLARRDATIASLIAERVELPLSAADLAVRCSLPLPLARRVWRALTETR